MKSNVKMLIREIEEQIPTITESMMKSSRYDRFLYLMTYYQVGKQLSLSHNMHKYFLDVGCGDGLFLQILPFTINHSREGFAYIGIDISLRKLHFAKSKVSKLRLIETHFVLADAEHLPFQDSLFEIETAIEVIEHLLDSKAFLFELCRVSKPKGQIVITTPSAYGTKGILTCLKKLCLVEKSANNREKYITVEGKHLPHRDFTLNEIVALTLPYFDILRIYSFNFGGLYAIISRFLPHRLLLWTTLSFENNAHRLPKVCGNNWIISAGVSEKS
jgi:ubiquinone/menaquinone biosynthesis C-methylase UbiE